MALLFDEAQGAFKDTGSRTSPMKKSTGLMRKQMSKMDEVAPRGHTLAYITPEEAQILNKGGGGVDAQGNQMQGPYGVPMYQGFMGRFASYKKPSTPTASTGFVDRQKKTRQAQFKESRRIAPPDEKGGGGYIAPSKPLEVTVQLPPQTGEAPPGEKGGGGYAPTGFVDRQKKTREAQTEEKKKTGFVDRQKKTREAQIEEQEDETPMDSGEFLKNWWRNREQEKKQLLPVEKPEIRISEFNLDKFNQKLGGIIGGAWGGGFTVNPNILGNLGLPSGNAINDILTNKEKGVGILNWKGGVSKELIEFLQENAPENESQKQQMINMLNRLPQNVQDNIKKAVSEGELSFDVVSVKPFMDGVTKLASGDLILDAIPDVLNELPKIENDIRQMKQFQKLQQDQKWFDDVQKRNEKRMRDIEEKYLKPLGKMYRQTPTGEWEIVPFSEAKANQSLMNNDLPEEFQVATTGSLRGLL